MSAMVKNIFRHRLQGNSKASGGGQSSDARWQDYLSLGGFLAAPIPARVRRENVGDDGHGCLAR